MARGWQYTKPPLASASLYVVRVLCVCVMHPPLFMGSLRVSPPSLSFLVFAFLFFFPFFLSFLSCFCFYALVGASLLSLLFLTFSVLVANPKKLLYYTVANPARDLPNRENITKRESLAEHPPTLLVRRGKHTHTHTPRMTGPDCVVMCNLINTHTHTHTHRARPTKRTKIIDGQKGIT